MSRLAAEYGVSNVALGKTCRRMNVPHPGRGYWARLAAGEKLKQPPLPPPRPGHDLWIYARPAIPASPSVIAARRLPRVPPPKVIVPRTLRSAHGAIVDLGSVLATAKSDDHGRLIVPGVPASVLVVSVDAHRRALLLLDALAKAFEGRGHSVLLRREGDRFALQATVNGIPVAIAVNEHLDRTAHVLSADEQDRVNRGVGFGIPKYDYDTGGRLQILLHGTRGRAAWSDTDTKALEGQLGMVVVAAEAEVEHRRLLRIAEEERQRAEEQRRVEREAEVQRQQVLAEQQRRERDEERRRQQALEERAKREAAQVRDLEAVVTRWRLARDARSFLDEFKSRMPDAQRGAAASAWIAWAERIADSWDPLNDPAWVPQEQREP